MSIRRQAISCTNDDQDLKCHMKSLIDRVPSKRAKTQTVTLWTHFTLAQHRHRRVLSSFHASLRPSVPTNDVRVLTEGVRYQPEPWGGSLLQMAILDQFLCVPRNLDFFYVWLMSAGRGCCRSLNVLFAQSCHMSLGILVNIGSGKGLSPVRLQAISWTSADLMPIES